MNKKRFTAKQIFATLKQAELGILIGLLSARQEVREIIRLLPGPS